MFNFKCRFNRVAKFPNDIYVFNLGRDINGRLKLWQNNILKLMPFPFFALIRSRNPDIQPCNTPQSYKSPLHLIMLSWGVFYTFIHFLDWDYCFYWDVSRFFPNFKFFQNSSNVTEVAGQILYRFFVYHRKTSRAKIFLVSKKWI